MCLYISQGVLIKEVLICNASFTCRFSDQNLFVRPPTEGIQYPTGALLCKGLSLTGQHIGSCRSCICIGSSRRSCICISSCRSCTRIGCCCCFAHARCGHSRLARVQRLGKQQIPGIRSTGRSAEQLWNGVSEEPRVRPACLLSPEYRAQTGVTPKLCYISG